jgi:uncharacterized membrane protein
MWAGVAVFALVLVLLVAGAPVALANGHVSLAQGIYKAFSPLCHQMPERSFHLAGHAFAVCSRCTGLYAGVAAGFVFYPLVRSLKRTDSPARGWLFLSVVPILIDWLLGVTGIWNNTHVSRFLTGAVLGATAAFFIVPGLMDVLQVDWRRFFAKSGRDEQQSKTPPPPAPVVSGRAVESDYGSPSSRI